MHTIQLHELQTQYCVRNFNGHKHTHIHSTPHTLTDTTCFVVLAVRTVLEPPCTSRTLVPTFSLHRRYLVYLHFRILSSIFGSIVSSLTFDLLGTIFSRFNRWRECHAIQVSITVHPVRYRVSGWAHATVGDTGVCRY